MRPEFENFLALIYTDGCARARFLADPSGEAQRAGLLPDECRALDRIDRVGLELAARSFARKRARQGARPRWTRWITWMRRLRGLRRFLPRSAMLE